MIREIFPCTRQLAGFLAERSSHRFRLPNILQSTSVTYLWNLHSLITVTRSYRNRTCFPFNQPIFNMKNILYFMYCSISRIKTAGTNYLLYETFNILAYPLPIYNNHFSLANHSKYGILIKYLQKHIWRRIEVVITGRTRNALALRGTRVRIPPAAPKQEETHSRLFLFVLHLLPLLPPEVDRQHDRGVDQRGGEDNEREVALHLVARRRETLDE